MNKNRLRSTVVTLIVAMVLIGMTFGAMADPGNVPNPPTMYKWLGLIGIQYPVVNTDSTDSSINENIAVQNTGFNESEDSKLIPQDLSQTQIGILSYSYESDLLQITVGEQSSSGWCYQYDPVGDPGNFIRSVYGEHYAVATDTWGSVIRSSSFTVDTYFGSEDAPDTATLHYDNLSLTRQVIPPVGSARSFSITFVLTNTGDSTLENVRFFQGVDYDIYETGGAGDYGWYMESSDTVWQCDDNYFKNGFHGSRTSSHHDCNYYSSMWSDMHSGNLNDATKYPESGRADCGVALQWDAGDLAPQASWDLTITFYFGEAAGIEANAGPDQNAGRSQPVTVNASGSSSVSNIISYEWDFDNDSLYEVSVSTPVYVYGGWTELGEYTVGLRVTDDEGRNDTDTVKITVVPNVDLTVSDITFTPTEINDGNIVIFNATMENIGTEDLTDDFYARFEIDDSYIGRQQVSGGLPAGGSVRVLQNWEADAGTHTVDVYADRGYYSSENNLIPEANETNNKLSQALPDILFPDLTITNLVWSPTEGINDGDTVTFTATVENIGTGSTSSDFYVGFEMDGNYIGSQRVTGLSAGSSTEISHSWVADAGTHSAMAVVDYYSVITESSEINNEQSHALPEILFPDLTVTDITWSPPTGIRHGDTVTFTAAVGNIGSTTSSDFYVRFEIDDGYIGHQKVSGGLAAGGSTAVNLDWVASAGSPTIKAIADEYNVITESSEGNNEKSEVLPPVPQPPQVNVISPNGVEIWHGTHDITWAATSPEGLGLTIKIELYNGHSYELIADGLPDTGTYPNWDTSRFADGSSVPDSTYYKMRVTATDTGGVSGSDLSDDWLTIWNTPIVEMSSAPYSQTTTESANATYYLTLVNKQPSADTFDLSVDNTDNAAVAKLSRSSITLNPWESGMVTLNITDETAGTYRVTARAASQTNAGITDEVPITTYVRNAFTVAVSAPRTRTSIGGNLTYNVEIANNQGTSDTFTLAVTGIEGSWCSMDSSCQLTAGGTKTIPLEISVPGTASSGEFSLVIQASSSNFGTTQETSAPLNVSAAPIIFDLTPADNTRTGATEVLFYWKTSVASTSDVFIKAEGEADYTLLSNESGMSHAVPVSDLSRDTWYNFYVRSNSTHGSSTSEVRSIFIDNGITFSQRNYAFTIERDYNQERTITIVNTDDEPHEVLLNVSGVPEDLALNFVGEGSMDQVISLHAGESKDIAIAFHAQDAQVEDYTILFNLTNLGAEQITDFANLKLHVHFPEINFTIEEISSDPHTLAKSIKLTNNRDPLTDLIVSASDELSSMVMFQPSIDHAYLGTGRSVTFDVIPVLSEDFIGASGTIIASAAGEEQNLSVDFTVPADKQVFVGYYPNVTIGFATEYDNDGIANTNPNGETINSYMVQTGNDTATGYIAQIMVEVLQNNAPVYDAEVLLEVTNRGLPATYSGTTDIWGKCIFAIAGPVGNCSYQASVANYSASTAIRNFSVSSTPILNLMPMAISWLSATDTQGTQDISSENVTNVTLDGAPYIIKATMPDMPEEAVPVLFITKEAGYLGGEIIGEIQGENIIVFQIGPEIDPGQYRGTVALQATGIIATSQDKNFTFGDSQTESMEALNYTYQMPFPVDAETIGVVEMRNEVAEGDGHKVIRPVWLEPQDSNNSVYVFTYLIIADQTMDDTLVVTAKDNNGTILYQTTESIHLEEYEAIFVDIPIPVFNDNGTRIEEFQIEVVTLDPNRFVTWAKSWTTDSGGVFDKEVWKIFWNDGVLTPHNKAGVVFKCMGSFLPGFGNVITAVDTVNNLAKFKDGKWSPDWIASGGGAGQLAGNPLGKLGTQNYEMAAGHVWNLIKNENPEVADEILKNTKAPLKKLAKNAKSVKNLGKILKFVGWAANAKANYDDWDRVTKEQEANKLGARETGDISVGNCINHAPLTNKFGLPGTIPETLSPVRNVDGVFVTLNFPRETPAHYQPFTTLVTLNGHEIGRIADAVPQGHYTFDADPSFLNYADAGIAENTLVLDVEGMNRGYYVPLEGYDIDISFKKYVRAVCAASQAEANDLVEGLGSARTHKADFAVYPEDIVFLDSQPAAGDRMKIEATIYNFGGVDLAGVPIQFLDGTTEIDSWAIPYIAPHSSETVAIWWTATVGSHDIRVTLNANHSLSESDYTNNEASKTISVTAPDSTSPVISNPQPPDGSTTSDDTPLISADLADPGSGINTTAARITLDDFDVTQNATVISSRVWYTPEIALANGVHNVSVYAEDNKGNSNSLDWSFTVSGIKGDLNDDGELTTADAAIALQMAVGARTPTTAADVSGDSRVTSLDALMILQAVAGSITL